MKLIGKTISAKTSRGTPTTMKGMELFTPFFTIENSVQSLFENREIGREVWHCVTGREQWSLEELLYCSSWTPCKVENRIAIDKIFVQVRRKKEGEGKYVKVE